MQYSGIRCSPLFVIYVIQIYRKYYILEGYRDSSVGIATCYGLDGPGVESRWGVRFSALGPTEPPVQWVPGLSRV